jgi:hypothetical protein
VAARNTPGSCLVVQMIPAPVISPVAMERSPLLVTVAEY